MEIIFICFTLSPFLYTQSGIIKFQTLENVGSLRSEKADTSHQK